MHQKDSVVKETLLETEVKHSEVLDSLSDTPVLDTIVEENRIPMQRCRGFQLGWFSYRRHRSEWKKDEENANPRINQQAGIGYHRKLNLKYLKKNAEAMRDGTLKICICGDFTCGVGPFRVYHDRYLPL